MNTHQKIYAITVSKNYSKILEVIITENADYFEKWYIATQEDDVDTIDVIKKAKKSNIEIVYYPLDPKKHKDTHAKSLLKGADSKIEIPPWILPSDKKPTEKQKQKLRALKQKGLVFDKGGAIRQIQKKILNKNEIQENDLVLLLDSDIVLPRNFKDIIANTKIEKNTIYGSYRKDYLFYDDFAKNKNSYDYVAYEGAGFFQMYLATESKYCKRTMDCGFVDAEFKEQFEKYKHIEQLTTSHLGAGDMNWAGKEIDSFLFNEEIEDFCNLHQITNVENNIESTKNKIIHFIEAKRLQKQQSKEGFPNYFVFGFPRSATRSIISTIEHQKNIYVAKKSYNKYLEYFENDNNFLKNEMENFFDYILNFPRLLGGNSNWVDFSDNLIDNFETNIERLWVTLKKRKWKNFNDVKFIFVVRNPIYRAYSEYNSYYLDFPASRAWNWCQPGLSFEDNINSELASFKNMKNKSECGSFLSNGCYFYYIKEIIRKLELHKNNFLVISIEELTGKNSKEHLAELSKFLNIDCINKIIVENDTQYESKLTENIKNRLYDFYMPYNNRLFELMGRKIDEWDNE